MATAETAAAAAVAEVANENKDGRGRKEAFDWATANAVDNKTLGADGNTKLDEYWEYIRNRSNDTPKLLTENLFVNKVAYWTWRKDFYSLRMEHKMEDFRRSQKATQAKIDEAEKFLNTVSVHGAEVAEQAAKAERLKKQLEAELAKLAEAGYVPETGDLEEEDA